MYSYLKGVLVEVNELSVCLDVNNIGYEIFISKKDLDIFRSDINNELTLYVYLQVKEDGHTLFGFINKKDKNIFLTLLTINGIGPKLAIAVLSELDTDKFIKAILGNDLHTLTSVSGIGKKTAERMVLELRDKFKNLNYSIDDIASNSTHIDPVIEQEAISGLSALGYSSFEIRKMLNSIKDKLNDKTSIEEIITLCLRTKSKL